MDPGQACHVAVELHRHAPSQPPLPQASLRLIWTLNRHFVNKRSSRSARPLTRASLVNSAEGGPGGEGRAGSDVAPSQGPRRVLWTTSRAPMFSPHLTQCGSLAISSSRRKYLQDARTSPNKLNLKHPERHHPILTNTLVHFPISSPDRPLGAPSHCHALGSPRKPLQSKVR